MTFGRSYSKSHSQSRSKKQVTDVTTANTGRHSHMKIVYVHIDGQMHRILIPVTFALKAAALPFVGVAVSVQV